MDGRIIVIPDVHERHAKVRHILKEEDGQYDRCIFLGDWFDSWSHNSFYHSEQVENTIVLLKEVMHDDRNILLYGNHDLHYFCNSCPPCTGYMAATQTAINDAFDVQELKNRFIFAWAEVFSHNLWHFTHAGLCGSVFGDIALGIAGKELVDIINQVCRSHWNKAKESQWLNSDESLIWIRPQNIKLIKGINQIYGHTADDRTNSRSINRDGTEQVCIDNELNAYMEILPNGDWAMLEIYPDGQF